MILTIKRDSNRFDPSYPANPKTLGEKIRKKRMDLHLEVKELASMLDVHEKSIINWEKEKVKLKKNYLRRVMEFLK